MIFVTLGTHNQEFTRLVEHIDNMAGKVKEKIIVQRGYTKYIPKNCESIEFAYPIEDYFKKARIIISHAAMSLVEVVKKYKKPVIIVPRQKKFKEHINDHQVEFAEYFSKKTGVLSIYNIKDLTPELLKKYKIKEKIDEKNLKRLQSFLKKIIDEA